jgi:HSP20 family protein
MAAMVRWDPFRDLMSIQSELNRLFGRTYAGDTQGAPSAAGSWVPALDVYETKEQFVVTMDLPGIEPESVDVTVEDSTLTVAGSRELSTEMQEENYLRVERRYGQFSRSLSLPPSADPTTIDARFDKGVLTITVPKAEEAKPKKITIKAKG